MNRPTPIVDGITIEHVIAVRAAIKRAMPLEDVGEVSASLDTLTLAYFAHRQTGALNELAKAQRDAGSARGW